MNLSKSQKIGIGILTFMPIFCFIGYFISFFLIFYGTINEASSFESNGPPQFFFAGFGLAILFLILAIISGLASLIFHIIHVIKNDKLKQQSNAQLMWILIIVLANGIGGIIYYFIEILPVPKESSLPSQEIE